MKYFGHTTTLFGGIDMNDLFAFEWICQLFQMVNTLIPKLTKQEEEEGPGDYSVDEKGRQVYLEGRLQTRNWEDREGVKRYTTEIVAQAMQMLGAAGGKGGTAKTVEERFPDEEPVSIPEDDIPF